MRKFFTICLLTLYAGTVHAQTKTPGYDVSVFKNAGKNSNLDELAAATSSKARRHFTGWAVDIDQSSGNFTNVYGKAITVPGNTWAEKSAWCIDHKLADFGVSPNDWKLIKEYDGPKAHYANYRQYINGHQVLFSMLGFRFTTDGKLVRIQMKNYGQPGTYQQPAIDKNTAAQSEAAVTGLENVQIRSKEVKGDWLWFPVPGSNGYELHPAWQVDIKGKGNGSSLPVELTAYIDAVTGKLLYRTNHIKDAFDVTVKGNIYQKSPLTPATLEPLPNLHVTVGPVNFFTDNAGVLSIPSSTNVTGNYWLRGKWSETVDASSAATPVFTQSFSGTGNTYTYPTTGTSSSRMVNAYYHVDKIHDFMKQHFTSFTAMDFPLPTNVDDNTGACNAFFNPSNNDINFFAAGSGCNSFAEISSIVYHEYGHAISGNFYFDMLGFPMTNPALNEGSSDVWAFCITKDPYIGPGSFQITGGGFIRTYNWIHKLYPDDSTSEPHDDGEMIAGAWWDVGVNLGSVDDMAQLFTATYFDTPDGPWGTEPQVYHDVLLSALLNDDNDANLMNGTPHFAQIMKAFAKHNIFLLGEVHIVHTELGHQQAGQPITVNASVPVQNASLMFGVDVNFKARSSSTWNTVTLNNMGGDNFSGQIPAQTEGSIIDYYIAVRTINNIANGISPVLYNNESNVPGHFISLPYQFGVGLYAKDSNTFENSVTGWTVGNAPGDNATSGKWIHAQPMEATFTDAQFNFWLSQTGNDHTTGSGKCLITGNATSVNDDAADADVDGGVTTAISPAFDLSGYHNPIIQYYRWYASNRGNGNAYNDPLVVQLNDGTTWYTVDSTYRSDLSWRRRIFAVKEYTNNLSSIKVKFMASDNIDNTFLSQGQNLVEAAVDDFFIYDDKTTGIGASPAAAKAKIYPNPADNAVYIELPTGKAGQVTMYDLHGKIVRELQLDANTTQYSIDTRSMVPGAYNIIVNTGNSVQSTTTVVRHK